MKSKKMIIISICILIILMIVILIILSKTKKQENEIVISKRENPALTTIKDVMKVKTEDEYITLEHCINKYFAAVREENTSKVLNILNNRYIQNNKIDESNVIEKINQGSAKYEEILIKEMYYREISFEKEYQYYIFGEAFTQNYEAVENLYLIANIDFENMTFSISLPNKTNINKEEYEEIIKELQKGNTNEFVDVINESSEGIKPNGDNKVINFNAAESNIASHYLEDFTKTAVYNTEKAYNLLEKEYREKRFGSLEKFKEYIANNRYNFENATLVEYSASNDEDIVIYDIFDTNNNYYLIKVKDIMEYTVILDFYTTDVEKIIASYDEGSTQTKVGINIQKIVAALNDKNYDYIYSKLNEAFKNKNYPTVDAFREYLGNMFFGKVNVEFNEFKNEGSTYIQDINLYGTTASNNVSVDMQIIMKLKDNRDFEFSFNIK